MPNWCNNYLSIKTSSKLLYRKIKTHMEQEAKKDKEGNYLDVGLLGLLYPEPDYEKTDTLAMNGEIADKGEAWWHWRVSNWGTKWDIELENIKVSSDGKTLTANFASAWSPPIEAYEKLKEQGYKISAFYSEMMMGFAGRFEDGTQEFIPSVNFEKDNWREAMSDEMADYLEIDFLQWLDWTDACEKEQARMDAQRDPLDNIEQELWYDTSAELE